MSDTMRGAWASASQVAAAKRWARVRRTVVKVLSHILLVAGSVIMVTPLLWLLSTSLKKMGTEFVYPPQWIPNPIAWENYWKFSEQLPVPFYRYFANTLFITVTASLGTVLTSSLAAFAFARLRFWGRQTLFFVVISTMLLPGIVTLIPTFLHFKQLRGLNSPLPLTVPYYFGGTAFSIFLMRQFFMTLPLELDEAARIDGASSFLIYARIIVPLAQPVLATVAIFQVLSHWNDFLAPLIYLNSLPKYTMALALRTFQNTRGQRVSYLMAASAIQILPVIILFFAAQKYFVQGIQLTGLSGR